MAFLTIGNVSIRGIGGCVPCGVEQSAQCGVFADSSQASAFMASTGVERRHIASDDITTADLCAAASEKLIAELGWERDSIDCVIFVSQTPDYILPATSCILQQRLGLNNECYTVDIALGCSGWVYGLSVIGSLMSGGSLKRGLLLVGDTLSKITSPDDKSAWPLFGDAGTVTALEFDTQADDMNFHLATDGEGYQAIFVEDGGARGGIDESSFAPTQFESGIVRNKMQLSLNGMDVFAFGISKAPQSINKLCDRFGIDAKKVDYFLFHQANKFMNEKIRKKLALSECQVPYSLRDFGNTSSATIPLTMVTQIGDDLRSKRVTLIGCGFGVGLSWGSVSLTTKNIKVCELVEI